MRSWLDKCVGNAYCVMLVLSGFVVGINMPALYQSAYAPQGWKVIAGLGVSVVFSYILLARLCEK